MLPKDCWILIEGASLPWRDSAKLLDFCICRKLHPKCLRPRNENRCFNNFSRFFGEVFDFGIIRRAKLAEIVEIKIHDIREFTTERHRMVDDRPFGGGDGMVLSAQPIFDAIENLTGCDREGKLS